jgi:hypothetical protein
VLDNDWLGRDASLFSAQQPCPFVPGVVDGMLPRAFARPAPAVSESCSVICSFTCRARPGNTVIRAGLGFHKLT